MLHRWFFVVVLLVGLAAMALAADTLLILDKVPVQLPGIRSAQLDGKQRKATLYHERWQVLRAGGPGLLTGGPAEWWHQPGRRYWKAPVEVSLCAPGCLPDSWRFVQAGSLLIDTLLPLQGSVDIWLRQGKQEPPWRVLTAVRPHIQPLLGGYLVKKQGDTLELGARVMQVADYRGKKIPWQPLNNQLPLLPPGNTAELYIHPPPGLPDSSLEYRLQQGKTPTWKPAGKLQATCCGCPTWMQAVPTSCSCATGV